MKTEIFELSFDSAEIAKFTPKEKVMYENDMRTERDLRNQLEYSHEQGVIKGLAKGLAKGREEERLKSIEEKGRIARVLLDNGIPPEVVEKAVGIKIPEVQGDRE